MLTTGDGGILCCRSDEDKKEAVKRRWFGMNRDAEVGPLGEREGDVESIGFKYHMNDIEAAIGLGNLDDFPQRWFKRQEVARKWRELLQDCPGITLPLQEPDRVNAYYFFPILVHEGRDELAKELNRHGQTNCTAQRRIDSYKVFGGMRDLPGQAEYSAKHLCLPCHGIS